MMIVYRKRKEETSSTVLVKMLRIAHKPDKEEQERRRNVT